MPNVMQKRGHDQDLAFTSLFSEMRPLQHVFGHCDRLAQIFLPAAALENIGEEGDDGVAGWRGHSAALACSSADRVDKSPSLSA